jgi:hypothetical protein
VTENCPRMRSMAGAMAQTRRQILVTHNQTHNANSRHRAPRIAAAQRGSPESMPQQRFDRESDRGFESAFLHQRVRLSRGPAFVGREPQGSYRFLAARRVNGQRNRAVRRRQRRETPNDPDRRRKPANYTSIVPAGTVAKGSWCLAISLCWSCRLTARSSIRSSGFGTICAVIGSPTRCLPA